MYIYEKGENVSCFNFIKILHKAFISNIEKVDSENNHIKIFSTINKASSCSCESFSSILRDLCIDLSEPCSDTRDSYSEVSCSCKCWRDSWSEIREECVDCSPSCFCCRFSWSISRRACRVLRPSCWDSWELNCDWRVVYSTWPSKGVRNHYFQMYRHKPSTLESKRVATD